MLNFLIVFLGGGLGSLSRYLVSLGIYSTSFTLASHKAFSTIVVNVIGCFFIAIVDGLLNKYNINFVLDSPQLRLLFITGFLGGFTTYSSFVLDIFNYTDTHSLYVAFIYFISSIVFGLLAFFIGIYLFRII